MKEMRRHYPVPVMCRVVEVSPSGYYAWCARTPSRHAREEARLEVEIRAAHKRTRSTCGPERLQQDLAAHGITAGICRIRQIRRKLGIRCKQAKKVRATTDSRHALPVADNLLDQHFTATAPNQVWTIDITYIATDQGWFSCAAHKDLFNGEIVGYALGPRITKDLVIRSLLMAVATKKPQAGLIHHSDRRSQYCSQDYQNLLEQFHMKASMSRCQVFSKLDKSAFFCVSI